MATSPLRYRRLTHLLPKHNYKVMPAAIEAGFTPKTARKQGKRIMASALRQQARDIIDMVDKKPSTNTIKQTMAEIVGLSRHEMMEALKSIALQQRDLGSALKVLGPLVREEGVVLANEDKIDVNVPILNVTVKDKSNTVAQLSSRTE